jgi:hypothetical protein
MLTKLFLVLGLLSFWSFPIQDGYSKNNPETGEPFGTTRQQARNCQGKNCPGVHTGHDCGPEDIEITPNPATATAGRPITFRFDATPSCNGQSVRAFRGTVKWGAGGPQESLPDSYGFFTHTFQSGGREVVSMEMSCNCFDPDGSSNCHQTGKVVVTVN